MWLTSRRFTTGPRGRVEAMNEDVLSVSSVIAAGENSKVRKVAENNYALLDCEARNILDNFHASCSCTPPSAFVNLLFCFSCAFRRRNRRSRKRETTSKKSETLLSASFRDISERPRLLPVQSTPTPGSSALKSPSYMNAKNVDVANLKSRFVVPSSSVFDDVTNDVSRGATVAASVPVRDIVAVIESPQEGRSKLVSANSTEFQDSKPGNFIRGHHKTASLPQRSTVATADCRVHTAGDDCVIGLANQRQSRSRSFSETQAGLFTVKKIVTAIESGNLAVESGEVGSSDAVRRSTSISGESGAKKTSCSSFVTGFATLGESTMEDAEDLPSCPATFYIKDSQKPSKLTTWCSAANHNNNNSLSIRSPISDRQFALKDATEALSPIKESSNGKFPPHSPDFLQVIEKVRQSIICSFYGINFTFFSFDLNLFCIYFVLQECS